MVDAHDCPLFPDWDNMMWLHHYHMPMDRRWTDNSGNRTDQHVDGLPAVQDDCSLTEEDNRIRLNLDSRWSTSAVDNHNRVMQGATGHSMRKT